MSHAEGRLTQATVSYAHAEGRDTRANGLASHVEGEYTIANGRDQHVFGQYNIADDSNAEYNDWGQYIEIVGNGTDDENRSNARTLDWNGNETLSGKLTIGAEATNNNDVPTLSQVQGMFLPIPAPPTTDGSYVLKAIVTNGEVTYQWDSI